MDWPPLPPLFSVALSKVVDFIVVIKGFCEFDVTLDLAPPKFVNKRVLPLSNKRRLTFGD